jgi:hypothetical protein
MEMGLVASKVGTIGEGSSGGLTAVLSRSGRSPVVMVSPAAFSGFVPKVVRFFILVEKVIVREDGIV